MHGPISNAQDQTSFEPEISGLRALAVLTVIVGHLIQRVDRYNPALADSRFEQAVIDYFAMPAGGVYLFFAISGYLIARGLRGSPAPLGLIGFYSRRLVRIALPYSAVLITTWAAIVLADLEPNRVNLFDVRPTSLSESLIASLTYMHRLLYGTFPRLFPPGWSLEVEVHFYLVAPLLCLAFRRSATKVGLGPTAAIALAGSGLLALATLRTGIPALQFTILVFLPLFVLGMAMEAVSHAGFRPLARTTSTLGWPCFAAFVLLQPWVTGQGLETAVRMILIAAMFASLASGRGSFRAACMSPWAVRLGLMSYAAYLSHLQVLHLSAATIARICGPLPLGQALLVNAVVALPLTLVAFLAFFAAVERPCLRLSRWRPRAPFLRPSHSFRK